MRKRIVTPTAEAVRARVEGWLDVQRAATVELTSEDKRYPIESAFDFEEGQGWRAAGPGPQTIRLIFDEPQRINRIQVIFEEEENSRTQEFALRWSADGGSSFKEIVRQQWNFSPPETKRETEEYRVELLNATVIELSIVPDISGGSSRASLKSMRLS
jgi:F5/8 type C domain